MSRFIRWRRNESVLDPTLVVQEKLAVGSSAAQAPSATLKLYARGVPQRVLYLSNIIDLGAEVNFGRLFWSATSMRMADDTLVPAPEAAVGLRVEVRTGRDQGPQYLPRIRRQGPRGLKSRASATSFELKESKGYGYVAGERPGVRASIAYDEDNWTFWSPAFSASGQPLNLHSGSHIQVKITLDSADFDAFTRLDSLWIEQAPLLARPESSAK